jgi:hypothetical protein
MSSQQNSSAEKPAATTAVLQSLCIDASSHHTDARVRKSHFLRVADYAVLQNLRGFSNDRF